MNIKIKEEFEYSLSSINTETSLDYLNKILTHHQKEELMIFLMDRYKAAPNLLNKFFQSQSDACTIEASEMERMESDFKGYVLSL